MLEKKTQGFLLPQKTRESRGLGRRVMMGAVSAAVLAVSAAGAVAQTAQSTQVPRSTQVPTDAPMPTPKKSKIGPAAPVTYDNKWEVYGGINFMNFQGGPGPSEAHEYGRRRVWGPTG